MVDAVAGDGFGLDAVGGEAVAGVGADGRGVGRADAEPHDAESELPRVGEARLDQRVGHAGSAPFRADVDAFDRASVAGLEAVVADENGDPD